MLLKLKNSFFSLIKQIKDIFFHPDKYLNLFWQNLLLTFQENFFFISLMIIFNFLPYLYLFCLYSQYENAIGGLFKPFADILLLAFILKIFNPKIRKYLQYLILILSGLLAFMELFVIGKYYTFTTAGIISVIIGTNFHEAIEFITMYFSFTYLLYFVGFGICIYLLKIYSKHFKLSLGLMFCLPYFFLYSFCYSILPGKNLTECLSITRLSAPINQAVEDAITFHEIYSNMNAPINISENNSSIPNVVFILGESTSRSHMSLYGYPLPTTPKLDKLYANNDLYVFTDIISPHAYTIGVLREVFTFHNYESPNKWYEYANLFDIVKQAGYTTYWLSNQETSGKWANVALAYANRSDYKNFTGIRQSYEKSYRSDGELLPLLYDAMNNSNPKNFYVLHLMGCHGDYENRYTPDFAKFTSNDETFGSFKTPEALSSRAKYDNAILYNDTIVTQVIEAFKDKNAIIIYMPDHGEEVYDIRDFSGHSDDNPTRSMLEIPFIIYTTEKFKMAYPQLDKQFSQAIHKPYMTDDLIHTILDIMQIKTPEYQETRSLINPYYNQERARIFLDKNYDTEMKAP